MKHLLILSVFLLVGTTHAQTLKVMTYNIRLDAAVDGVNQWLHRKEKVFALLNQHNADVVGLQEVMHHQLQDLLNALPQYAHAGVGRDDGKEKGEYSAILYRKDRFELVSTQTTWLSETPDVPGSKSWDAAITRIVTQAVLKDKTTGKTFTHFNTHFDHIGKEARTQSARLIRKMVCALPPDMPAVVTGDFNAEPSEPPYPEILKENVLLDTRPNGSQTGTYCTFAVNSEPCKLIDYIFHTKAWQVTSYQVIQDSDGTYYPSDHLPVMVTLSLK